MDKWTYNHGIPVPVKPRIYKFFTALCRACRSLSIKFFKIFTCQWTDHDAGKNGIVSFVNHAKHFFSDLKPTRLRMTATVRLMLAIAIFSIECLVGCVSFKRERNKVTFLVNFEPQGVRHRSNVFEFRLTLFHSRASSMVDRFKGECFFRTFSVNNVIL